MPRLALPTLTRRPKLRAKRAVLAALAGLTLLGCQPKDPPPPTPIAADPSVFAADHEASSLDHSPVEPLIAQVKALIDDEAFVHVVVNAPGDGYDVGVYGLTLEAMADLEQSLDLDVPVKVVARPVSRVALEDLTDQIAERYDDGTVTALGVSLSTGTLHVGVADEASVEPVHAAVVEMIDQVQPNLGEVDLTVQVSS